MNLFKGIVVASTPKVSKGKKLTIDSNLGEFDEDME